MGASLNTGAWIDAGQPLVLLGDSGTGKTHRLIGLGLAACEQGRRVRYITTAALVNELAEAASQRQLPRLVSRYGRPDQRAGLALAGMAGRCHPPGNRGRNYLGRATRGSTAIGPSTALQRAGAG